MEAMSAESNRRRAGICYSTSFDAAEFRALHHRGLTLEQLAEHFKVTVRTASRWRKNLGLTKPPAPAHVVTDEARVHAAAMFEDGASYQEVQRTLGIGVATLQKEFPGRAWRQPQIDQHGQAVMIANQKLRKLGVAA